MDVRTHLGLEHRLCGAPTSLAEGVATATLRTTPEMAADAAGLVHGGFVFGLADHAAMLAVNDPLVVLAGAELRFTAPVRVGDEVVAEARRVEIKGRKHLIDVEARVGDLTVLTGRLTAVVLDRHVLEGRTP